MELRRDAKWTRALFWRFVDPAYFGPKWTPSLEASSFCLSLESFLPPPFSMAERNSKFRFVGFLDQAFGDLVQDGLECRKNQGVDFSPPPFTMAERNSKFRFVGFLDQAFGDLIQDGLVHENCALPYGTWRSRERRDVRGTFGIWLFATIAMHSYCECLLVLQVLSSRDWDVQWPAVS